MHDGSNGVYSMRAGGSDTEPLYRRSLEIRRRACGDRHAYVGQTLADFSSFMLRDALRIREPTRSPDHLATASTRTHRRAAHAQATIPLL